jgi:hypothetical protein
MYLRSFLTSEILSSPVKDFVDFVDCDSSLQIKSMHSIFLISGILKFGELGKFFKSSAEDKKKISEDFFSESK